MRVQDKPEDVGRCGCGQREYCDGSHGLSAAQWQEVLAKEKKLGQASGLPSGDGQEREITPC